MDSEQSQNFNERLSQWVGNQGFWFQVRYSMSGSGMKGRAMIHLLRLAFRLLIFLLVAAVGGWIYLIKRSDTGRFSAGLREDIQAGLTATAVEMRGPKRLQGELEISRLAAEGGNDTFFSTLEAKNIHCKMGLKDGLVGIWRPGIISITRLDIDLRAGADDATSASKLATAWFRKPTKVDAQAFEVADATVRWGYWGRVLESERTQGLIESSALKVQRTESGWRMSFKGGYFSQNWLRKLEIVNLIVVCDAEGLVFEKAELRQGKGTVDFTGLRLIGGERPQVAGTAKIRNLVLAECLPASLLSLVEGSISGDFRVFGTTNSADGIGFEGQVLLDDKDMLTLREQIYLLKALSVVDYKNKYHRIDFREGSFQMKTTRGGLELSEVKLKAGDAKMKEQDLFTLEGKMSVRLPTAEESQFSVAKGSTMDTTTLLAGANPVATARDAAKGDSAISLKQAAMEARRIREGGQSAESFSLFDRLDWSAKMRDLESQEAERMSRMLRYEGMFQITIPGDAFDQAPTLQEKYPVNKVTGRIPIVVPISGTFYELTLKQAEELYVLGQRKR